MSDDDSVSGEDSGEESGEGDGEDEASGEDSSDDSGDDSGEVSGEVSVELSGSGVEPSSTTGGHPPNADFGRCRTTLPTARSNAQMNHTFDSFS
uniref:Uncharacterized protein n=1 Tax=Nonomuraea gerenzanensis TaxID=93944 RepID=A0A1M4E4Y7_9ACTN|nr:hypothetical protein BN4615_P3413 [Nonomuraea gerenzanensis]